MRKEHDAAHPHRLVSHEPAGCTGVMTTSSKGPTVALTTDPAEHPAVFAAAFNTFDPAAVEACYESSGLLAPQPGLPVTGHEREQANAELMRLGIPIQVWPRHTYAYGDLALLIVDWTIEGTDLDGNETRIGGTATDVARRGPDGFWRYAIDNPHGTA